MNTPMARRWAPLVASSVAVIASLALQTPARAYSDEAVNDADTLLKQTRARFVVGEVYASDLALAHYNLLDMKQKAGQLSQAGFCRAAKADLSIVAQAYEEPKDQPGAKRTWLDAIAGMTASRDKCQQAIAATETLAFGSGEPVYSDAAEKAARDAVAATSQRFSAGEVTQTDVAQAQYDLIALKYAGKRISRATYCQTGVPDLLAIAAGIESEAAVGQRDIQDVITAKRRLYSAKATCTADLHGDPKDMLMLRRSGDDHLSRQEYDAAIADFTKLIALSQQNADAFDSRGSAYVAKGDGDHAIADFSAAIGLDPDNLDALKERGSALYGKKDFDGAIADYSAVLKREPDDITAIVNRGGAFFLKKDFDKTVADYSKALELASAQNSVLDDSIRRDVLAHRAYAYVKTENFDHAIADYTELLRLDPKNAGAYNDLGNAYFAKGDYDHAIAALDETLKLDPDNAAALMIRGGAYAGKGDHEHAIADFGGLIRLDPRNAPDRAQRAYQYEQVKDYGRAIADYDEMIRLDPNNAEAFNDRCWDRALAGQFQDALPDCDESLRLRAGDANTLDSRGFVHLMLGQLDAAVTDYDAALQADPKLATAMYGRGVARTKKGDAAAGEVDMTAAKALQSDVGEKFASYGVK